MVTPFPASEGQDPLRPERLARLLTFSMMILGFILLTSSIIVMTVFLVQKIDVTHWAGVVALSIILIFIGGVGSWHFRESIARQEMAIKIAKNPVPVGPMPGYPSYAAPYGYPIGAPAYGYPAPSTPQRLCMSCGRPVPTESKFCPFCGASLTATASNEGPSATKP